MKRPKLVPFVKCSKTIKPHSPLKPRRSGISKHHFALLGRKQVPRTLYPCGGPHESAMYPHAQAKICFIHDSGWNPTPTICQRDWLVNAHFVAKLFSRMRPWARLTMEMMVNEHDASMLRDESNQISPSSDK
jgi:hypothetical protein